MCALYVRCVLSVLQKECRKVWGASYTLGARYRVENTVFGFRDYFKKLIINYKNWSNRKNEVKLNTGKGKLLFFGLYTPAEGRVEENENF